MAKIIQKISVEVAKPNFFQAITAKQNDCNSRFLKATFVNEGAKIDVSDATKATINARRSDGEAKCFVGEVNTDGTVTVPLHSWILEIEGKVDCDITTIDKNDEKLTSTKFTVFVEAASFGSGDITSDPQKDLLLEVLESFNNLGDLSNVGALLDKKADKDHSHDDKYYSKTDIDNSLAATAAKQHNHDDRYYTEAEIDTKLNQKHNTSSYNNDRQILLEMINGKATKDHKHDDRYYTKEAVDSMLEGVDVSEHNHDDRYYTESETKALLSTKADSSYVEGVVSEAGSAIDRLYSGLSAKADKNDVLHTVRIPSFNEIDNSVFAGRLRECASSWISASEAGDVCYGSLSTDEKINGVTTDMMETRCNPMLYSAKANGVFTGGYRDIWSTAQGGVLDSEGKGKTVNCITLCNMLVMGVPYKGSRLCGHENVIGMSGYAFDICKLLGNSIMGDNREIPYNPKQKLDITTFENILTQDSFFTAYGQFGLVKTLKTSKTATDGQIWYDSIRPGDVLWTGSHSMFCLATGVDENGNIKISGVHACSSSNITNFNFTVTDAGVIDGISYTKFSKVARPYLSYKAPESSTASAKLVKGPFIGIGKNTDLNTLLTVGEYRCVSTSNVNSLSHKPTDLADTFRLTVENLTKDEETLSKNNDFMQTIVSAKGEIYTRVITTYNYSVASPHYYPWRKHSMENHTVTTIADDADLNSFTKIGEYRCTSYERARKLKNRPAIEDLNAFRLIVDNTMGDTFTVQEGSNFTQRIREVSGREFYRRIYWDNGAIAFGGWHKVLTESVATIS